MHCNFNCESLSSIPFYRLSLTTLFLAQIVCQNYVHIFFAVQSNLLQYVRILRCEVPRSHPSTFFLLNVAPKVCSGIFPTRHEPVTRNCQFLMFVLFCLPVHSLGD